MYRLPKMHKVSDDHRDLNVQRKLMGIESSEERLISEANSLLTEVDAWFKRMSDKDIRSRWKARVEMVERSIERLMEIEAELNRRGMEMPRKSDWRQILKKVQTTLKLPAFAHESKPFCSTGLTSPLRPSGREIDPNIPLYLMNAEPEKTPSVKRVLSEDQRQKAGIDKEEQRVIIPTRVYGLRQVKEADILHEGMSEEELLSGCLRKMPQLYETADTITEEKKYTLKRTLKTKAGEEFAAGTAVTLNFSKSEPRIVGINVPGRADPVRVHVARLTKYLKGLKPPSIKTMEKWVSDGYAKSITGKKVDMDGVGPDGAPSWLLVMGYI